MKEKFPEFFKVLTEVPVKFVNRDYTQNTTRVLHAPLILLDKDSDFHIIRFSIAYMSIMDCSQIKWIYSIEHIENLQSFFMMICLQLDLD